MTFFRFGVNALVCLSISAAAYSATIFTTVPFENIPLSPGQVVQANYAFGLHAIIFCFENNLQLVGNIKWPFKNQIHSSSLPVSLITNSNFDGFFANSSGIITISNTSKVPLVVNCDFAF